jgi:hypothetical protein
MLDTPVEDGWGHSQPFSFSLPIARETQQAMERVTRRANTCQQFSVGMQQNPRP